MKIIFATNKLPTQTILLSRHVFSLVKVPSILATKFEKMDK